MQPEKEIQKKEKNNSYIKRVFKWILYIIATLVVINVLLYILLSIPAIQKKLADFALDKLEETLHTKVKIDNIKLTLLNYVDLEGVYIEDLSKDTLLYTNNLEVKLDPWKLLKGKLLINAITVDDFTIKLSQKTPNSDFNFQFLIDAFAGDTTTTDNSENNLKIGIESVSLKKGKLTYDVLSEPTTPTLFNASHISISDINSELQLPSVNPALKAKLNSLSFTEKSGLFINNLSGDVTSDKNVFYIKNTELKLPNSILIIPEGNYNLSTDSFNIKSDNSVINAFDLVAFMPNLKYLKNNIKLETEIRGKLPKIRIQDLILGYGENTTLSGSAFISDYANYDRADLELNIKNLSVSSDAITDFSRLGDSTFVAPDILKTLGTIRLQGKLDGKLNDLDLDAEAWAKYGSIRMKAKGSTDTTFQNFKANVKLQTQNFNLGSLLEMPELGRISADLNLDVIQNPKQPLKAEAKGNIVNLQYNKNDYNNIPFSVYYNQEKMGLWLNADQPFGKVVGNLDMTQEKNAKIDLDFDIQKLHLDRFYKNPEWKNPLLSMHIKGYVRGMDLKSMNADVIVENFNFSHDTLSFIPGTFALQAGTNSAKQNFINLTSSLINAKIEGYYDFMLLSDEISAIMYRYLPSIFKYNKRKSGNKNNFDFSLAINNTEKLGQILNLPVDIIEPLTLNGNLNTKERKLQMSANIPLLQSGGMDIRNTTVSLINTDSLINIDGKSTLSTESEKFNFDLHSIIQSDTIHTSLLAKTDSAKLNMNVPINFLSHFSLNKKNQLSTFLQFSPSYWNIGKLRLMFTPAKISNENNKTFISNLGLMEGVGRSLNRYLGIDGVISNQKQDTLNISFFNSNLGKLFGAFDIDQVGAIANGDIKLTNILDMPEMYTNNMSLSDIRLFGDTLGELRVRSKWSNQDGAIKFEALLNKNSITSSVRGLVYPEQDSLRLRINLDRLSTQWIQPFFADILNKFSGSISTDLLATGKISSPQVNGWLGVNDTYIGIDYTNVTYHISDTIQITSNKIGFDNLILEDPNKNKASVNALATYKNFDDIRYSLDAKLNNFMILNTESRIDSLFYGKVFANGSLSIKGKNDVINMNMTVQNGKNSDITIQIPQTTDATVYNSIVYINTPEEDTKKTDKTEEESVLPLKLAANLNVTPDILLNIIINPLTGDAMQVKGSGSVKFSYDMPTETMTAFGDYIISDGFVKLKLENLANMTFKIRDGSKLVFNGDPMRTKFDITAYKRVKTDLTTLDASFENMGTSPKVYAECVLGISGDMTKMNLTYDISIPDASDDIQQRVKTIISTNEQKVTQFAYLLAIGSFRSDNSKTNLANGLLTNIASSALSSSLNAVLGNVIGKDWEIGTNIASNDGTFSDMDMSVSLSRKFLDNKLEFNTNLGYRTDEAANNSFIGDFDVSYALTRFIKLKVFNRTNDKYYNQAPTTQGIGIVYTKQAKTLKQLFQLFRKRRKQGATDR